MTDTTVISENAVKRGPDVIEVWVCPNCGTHYASSNSENLNSIENYRTSMQNTVDEDPSEWGKSTGPRSLCQVCLHGKGVRIERVKRTYVNAETLSGSLSRVFDKLREEEEQISGVSSKQVPYNPARQAKSTG